MLTFASVFVLAVLSLALGALFGTAYRAFGTKGALLTGLAAAVLVVAVTLLSASNKEIVGSWLGALGVWAAVVVAAIAAAISIAGSYAANRLARL